MKLIGPLLATLLTLAGAGCTVLQHETASTKSMLQGLTGMEGRERATNALELVQTSVMREADLYVGAVAQATDDLRLKVPTPETRNLAQQWKLTAATAAYINATGEHPAINAVDMVVLATMSRYVVEDYWVGEKFGEAALPLLATHRQLETNAWATAQIILTPGQQDEVRALLARYRERYPHLRYVAAVRMRELAGFLGKMPSEAEASQRPGSLFSLLYLNPLAGLDPTTQAIQQTRLLAARAMYYAQRAPTLLSWQVELTLYQIETQPEARGVLSNFNQVASSATIFAKTAEGLPQLVNDQREAAIAQFFDRLAVAQTNLLAQLASEETKLRGTLNETRQTLQAGSQMADSVNSAIKSLDAFIHYVSPPDTNAAPAAPDTNSHPFNVLDYGTAATQIGSMATQLNALILSLNQSEAQVARLSRQATADAKEVVTHAFQLGVVLVLLCGVVLGVVIWIYRYTRAPRGGPATQT